MYFPGNTPDPIALTETAMPKLFVASKSVEMPDFNITSAALSSDFKRENVSLNFNNTFSAFTSSTSERIFFEDLVTHERFEIQGLPLSSRPFSNLIWNDTALTFDRWSQANFGIRYTVDVAAKELISALPMAYVLEQSQ